MDKIKIMMLSDSVNTPTGFANQTRELAKRLCKCPDFEVVHIGHNYHGKNFKKVVYEDGEEINFRQLSGSMQPYAKDRLPTYWSQEKPDIFWVLLDTFMLHDWIYRMPFTFQSVMYYPSDGGYFPNSCENVLKKFSHPIAMAKYAQQQVKDLFNIDAGYIPHGTNTKDFYPLKEEEKRMLKLKYGIPQDAFVFGDVARNQGRKNIAATVESFGKFIKNNPNSNAYLLLHCDPNDMASHCNLFNIAQRWNILDKLKFSGMKFFQGFPQTEMNGIYNAMDVRVSTTTGEGFGICTIESMAAEIPNIITDYTTTKELILDHNAGLGAKLATETVGSWDVNRGFVDTNHFAEQMEVLYNDENIRNKFGKNGRKAVQKYYEWDSKNGVFNQWKDKLRKIVGE